MEFQYHLIYISLWLEILNISSCTYWLFILLLLRIVQFFCPLVNWVVGTFGVQFFELLTYSLVRWIAGKDFSPILSVIS
jgi:hypothetical protein